MAWHFKAFEREQVPADRVAYAAAEEHARAGHLGLWRDATPLPPWDFRRDMLQQSSHRPADKRGVATFESP